MKKDTYLKPESFSGGGGQHPVVHAHSLPRYDTCSMMSMPCPCSLNNAWHHVLSITTPIRCYQIKPGRGLRVGCISRRPWRLWTLVNVSGKGNTYCQVFFETICFNFSEEGLETSRDPQGVLHKKHPAERNLTLALSGSNKNKLRASTHLLKIKVCLARRQYEGCNFLCNFRFVHRLPKQQETPLLSGMKQPPT